MPKVAQGGTIWQKYGYATHIEFGWYGWGALVQIFRLLFGVGEMGFGVAEVYANFGE